MTPIRAFSAIVAAPLALGAALAIMSAGAQSPAPPSGAPCRLVWKGATSGGDYETTEGELQLTRSAPQGGGSFIMFGSGQATVTYHSGAGLTITRGSPYTAKLMVILTSDDGRTAEIDIDTAPDEPEHEIVADPGGFNIDTEAAMPPTVTVPLQDGVTTPYSESFGSGRMRTGKTGTIKLLYCKSPGN